MTAALRCAACGWTAGSVRVNPYPFRCPNSGTDDGDHVVRKVIGEARDSTHIESANPFVRYRSVMYSWHAALDNGMSDAEYVSLVQRLDEDVARVAGSGFHVTPFGRADRLSTALGFGSDGGVWVKDETANVAGSHKARHLMGVALYLRVVDRLGCGDGRPLAVASCGNAALAAGVLARALDRRLLVFVPEHPEPRVIARLQALGACVTHCSRAARTESRPSDRGFEADDTAPSTTRSSAGDPCYLAFRRAIQGGALPFSCQGNENGLAIEGATTLAFEMLDACGNRPPDRLFVQAGGGALASACVQGLDAAVTSGRIGALPKIHAVQTMAGYPLKRAYDRVIEHVFERLAAARPVVRRQFAGQADRARYLVRAVPAGLLDESFRWSRTHRSSLMWPWDHEPHSVAGGILDDETYDWAVIVEAMVRTAGFPVLVDEAGLIEAHDLARAATGIDVDHTGSAGFAGLVDSCRSLDRPPSYERVAVLFTGVTR